MSDKLTNRAAYFPKSVVEAAQHAERETGCPSAVTLAQFALESDYGKYDLHAFNYFGIKSYGNQPHVTCRTQEYENGHYVTVNANFRKFASPEEAMHVHGYMLMRPDGYYKAAPFAHDWRAFIKHIAPIYATDKDYSEKLIKIVEDFHLYDFNIKKAS